jgi:hypothetical protein
MGFRLSSFIGGVAKGYSEQVAEEEKNGKQFGLLAGKNLLEMHQKAREDKETEIEKRVDIIKSLRSFNPDFTERELRDLAANNGVVDIITKQKGSVNFDPSSIDWKSLIKKSAGAIAETPDKDTKTAEQRVREEYMGAVSTAPADSEITLPSNIGSRGQKAMQKTIDELATVYGVSKEELMAARNYKKTQLAEGGIQVDFGVFSPQDIDKDINKAQVELKRAIQSGDQGKIDVARNSIFDLNDIKNSGDPKNLLENASVRQAYAKSKMEENPSEENNKKYADAVKKYTIATEASVDSVIDKARTYEEGNTALISQIVPLKLKENKTDSEKKALASLETILATRQALHKGPQGEEGASVKAGTLVSVAKSHLSQYTAAFLGPGNYYTDPATGNIIPTGDGKNAAKATIGAYDYLIDKFTARTGENKGKVLSPGHEAALIAVGINVDQNGVPTIPAFLGERAAGASVGSTTPTSPLPVKPQPSPNLQVPLSVQAERDRDRAKILQGELEKSKKLLAETTDPAIKKRLQGDIDAVTRELGGKVEPTTPTAAPAAEAKPMAQQDVMAKKFVLDNANSKDPAVVKDVEAIRNKLRSKYGNNAGV